MAYEVFQPCESVMQNTEMFIRPWLKMQCNTISVHILFDLDMQQHHIYVDSNSRLQLVLCDLDESCNHPWNSETGKLSTFVFAKNSIYSTV